MEVKVEVKLGKYKINSVAEHWAIKIGSIWYEVEGASKKQTGERNRIVRHSNDSKYTFISTLGFLSAESGVDDKQIEQKILAWLKEHPYYAVNGDNCQLFVKHMAWDLLGVSIETQNSTVGATLIGIGIGSTIVGLVGILLGTLIRGGH
jgi:hypothetical protein